MKIAILDDYQQVAKQSAEWSSLPRDTQVDSFAEHIADQKELVRRLQPYDVIIAMRERTRFPAQVIDALPNLRLLVSTGGRNPSRRRSSPSMDGGSTSPARPALLRSRSPRRARS